MISEAAVGKEKPRWTGKRKAALLIDIWRGKLTMAEASYKYDLPLSQVEEWMRDGRRALENGLKTRPRDEELLLEAKFKELYAKIGKMTIELEARKRAEMLSVIGEMPGVPYQKIGEHDG